MEGTFLDQGLRAKGEVVPGELFIGESEKHVKEGSGNRQLSPKGPHWGTSRGLIYLGLWRDR